MSGEHLVYWLRTWYAIACIVWAVAIVRWTRIYIVAMIRSGRPLNPLLIKAVATATIGFVETGFYAYVINYADRDVGLVRWAITLLPVGISLQAVVYVVTSIIITRSDPDKLAPSD